MNSLMLSDVAAMCGGCLIQGRPSDLISGISKDTRTLGGGDLYVALSGENFDGHDFIQQAGEKGAAGILVSQLTAAGEEFSGGMVHVKDTLVALQELARNYRRTLSGLRVVGVTGSNGKTSTKDFMASIMRQDHKISATLGNLNNHIGLPLTVLATDGDDAVGVWEMGMSHAGEIELLAQIAGPDIGVITNVGVAHLEYMKSREAIAVEKGMLAESLPQDGCLIMPEEDGFTREIQTRTQAQLMTVGIACGDLRAENLQGTSCGTRFQIIDNKEGGECIEVEIAVPGQHMVVNALLAAATARILGLEWDSIATGLKDTQLTSGRLQRSQLNGVEILDDSYNANPDSMSAALQTLAGLSCGGRRIAALGVMAELGDQAERAHRALASEVESAGVDVLVTVGDLPALIADDLSQAIELRKFENCDQAGLFLKQFLQAGDLLLVKGSRSAGMEKVIERLKD